MLRRVIRPANLTRIVGAQTKAQPMVPRVVGLQRRGPPCVVARGYAQDKYFFPDERNEGLEHSQVFKVSQAIQQDHQQLEYYYNKIINSKDQDEQKRYQNAFVWELARHSIAEELVVYPVLERDVSDGGDRAQKDREQHQEVQYACELAICRLLTDVKVKEKLYTFQKLSPSDSDFIPTIKSLWQTLSQHIKEEEREDLVKLEEALSTSQSKELSRAFEKTKSFTPTRSHPSSPDKPPFETVVGLMTAPIDKLRDLFRKFPDDDKAQNPGSSRPPM
ncbi:hypothetical protein DL768_006512 [Monosporascus sp. mg162]|nr:hypothetical protein DL768_006512 [Monosporascus sp. mg162]